MRELPAGYTARGAVLPDDLDGVAALYAACDRADVGFVDPTRAAIEHDWRAEGFDPALDAVVIEAPDGAIVAAGTCSWFPGAPTDGFGRVHPARRGDGLGAWLVGWALVLEYAVSASAVAVGWSNYPEGYWTAQCICTFRSSSPRDTSREAW